MYQFAYYSGIIAILSCWLLIVLPVRVASKSFKHPVSAVAKKKLQVVNVGMVICGIAQMLFGVYLGAVLSLNGTGVFLYTLAAFLLVLGGVSNPIFRLKTLHASIAKVGFVLHGLGIFFIAEPSMFYGLAILGGMGSIWYINKNKLLVEYWVFAVSTLWTLTFYI